MISLRLAQVAEAVGGVLNGADATVAGISLDSREAQPGDLFVALPGERVDGAAFIESAFGRGATAALTIRADVSPAVVVPDVIAAFGKLAAHVRSSIPELLVIGVTGSSGKTSTKDLIAQVLETVGPTVAPVASYNNEIGLPRTVLRANGETRFLVLEFGARGAGHITQLCRIARPDVAVVLNVGTAHVGEFGSRAAIAAAKAELVEGVVEGGIAVLNLDDPLVAAMAAQVPGHAHQLTFGESAAAEIRAESVALDDLARPSFDLVMGSARVQVTLGLHGRHQVSNALAAAAAAVSAGVDLTVVGRALSNSVPRSAMRMAVRTLPNGVTLINDAYNANPESVTSALRSLAAIGTGRRTWAVLGEMRELGGAADDLHVAIGQLAAELEVRHIVVVGTGARGIFDGATSQPGWSGQAIFIDTVAAAADLIADEIRSGDVVLVKASRAVGLELVAEDLERRSAP